jgi:3-isopropylmalate/(R)-2-methylmalate dehydratase small subunit
MEPFISYTGRGVPLRHSNVDTDQIIPASYLKRVSRTGFGDGLFAAWREDPAFVLNEPAYAGATILIAGTDFGIGSSREHAVWALADYGFRAVIAPRFGDIFRTNATKAGLLPVRLPADVVSALHDAVESDPATQITVDLDDRTVSCPAAGGLAASGPVAASGAAATSDAPAASGAPAVGGRGLNVPFEIDDYTRWRLMEGLDDIGLTLRNAGEITEFERHRPSWLPVTS